MNNNRQTFAKNERLLTAIEYRRVFNKAIKFSDRYWVLLVRKNNLNYSRLGLAVAKKKFPWLSSAIGLNGLCVNLFVLINYPVIVGMWWFYAEQGVTRSIIPVYSNP